MKKLLILIASLYSVSGFCCKPAFRMRGEALFVSGVTNKLSATEAYRDFEIKSITKGSSAFLVKIADNQNKKCIELKMESYGTGSCSDFTAKIVSEKQLKVSECN